MNERGKSDSPVVPAKLPNKAASAAAEAVEERGLAKGNTASKTRPGHRAGPDAPSALGRVREVAREDREARFTALLHHVTVDRLRAAFWAIRPKARAGGGRGDMGGLPARVGGQTQRPARTAAHRALLGETITAGVYPEGRRAAAAAWHCLAGGQDCPAGRRRGAQRHLRGGFPGFLPRIPAGAWSASSVGRARGRDRAEERMNRLANRWLPPARVKHPFSDKRFDARTRGRSPMR